jgi:hypothetical protein
MPSLDSDVLYILNNTNIEFKTSDNKIVKNIGLENFIRIYKFIPDGIKVIKKRSKKMAKKAPAKAPAKKPMAKPAKPAKKPAKK